MNTNLAVANVYASNVNVCRICTGQRKSNPQNFLLLKAYCRHPKCNLRLRLTVETCNIKSKFSSVHPTNARISGRVTPLVQIPASASLHPAKNLVNYIGKFIDINQLFRLCIFSWHSIYLARIPGKQRRQLLGNE